MVKISAMDREFDLVKNLLEKLVCCVDYRASNITIKDIECRIKVLTSRINYINRYNNLPNDIKEKILNFIAKDNFDEVLGELMDRVKNTLDINVHIWRRPSPILLSLVNMDQCALQHPYHDFNRYLTSEFTCRCNNILCSDCLGCLNCRAYGFPCTNCSILLMGSTIQDSLFKLIG